MRFVRHSTGVVGVDGGSAEQLPLTGNLRHAICVAKETEPEAYAQAKRTYILDFVCSDWYLGCFRRCVFGDQKILCTQIIFALRFVSFCRKRHC